MKIISFLKTNRSTIFWSIMLVSLLVSSWQTRRLAVLTQQTQAYLQSMNRVEEHLIIVRQIQELITASHTLGHDGQNWTVSNGYGSVITLPASVMEQIHGLGGPEAGAEVYFDYADEKKTLANVSLRGLKSPFDLVKPIQVYRSRK
jgi:hypothetical protein